MLTLWLNKRLLKYLSVIKTNWIHLVGFYISTYIGLIIFRLLGMQRYSYESWNSTLFLNLLTIPLLFFTYGLIILICFHLIIILMDLLAFRFIPVRFEYILIVEWLVIIPPFVYWAFKYDYWLWLFLTASFLCTQFIRKRWLKGIVNE